MAGIRSPPIVVVSNLVQLPIMKRIDKIITEAEMYGVLFCTNKILKCGIILQDRCIIVNSLLNHFQD